MREIKFRGKSSIDNVWIFGHLIKVWTSYHILCDNDMCEDGHHIRQDSDIPTWVEENTVGQYTSLKDKNGVEIYEGDVLKSHFSSEPFGIVTWHDNGYFFIDTSFGEWRSLDYHCIPLGDLMDIQIDMERVQLEVIGNIHDNPELLEKE